MDNTPGVINIVFDGPPSHDAPRFIEVETLEGASVRVGEWVRMPEDRSPEWALQIRLNHEPDWEHELHIALGSAENMRLERDRLARKLEAISKLVAEEKYKVSGDRDSYSQYWEGYEFCQDLVQQIIESPEEEA